MLWSSVLGWRLYEAVGGGSGGGMFCPLVLEHTYAARLPLWVCQLLIWESRKEQMLARSRADVLQSLSGLVGARLRVELMLCSVTRNRGRRGGVEQLLCSLTAEITAAAASLVVSG